jgi:hypothetical protein
MITGCAVDNSVGSEQTTTRTTAQIQTAQTQTATPDMVVKDLYKLHDANNSPFFQTEDRALTDQYFTKDLADLIWQNAVRSQNSVGAFGADPLYDAQDVDITDFNVQTDQIDGDQSLVLVTFKNFGMEQSLIFNLVLENSIWKVSNITSDNYNLQDTLQVTEDNSSDTDDAQIEGNFEGTYQVGEITCTVNPIKMAFEVSWQGETGTEIFFFQGTANDKYIFTSDPETGKANVFSFDDENYSTGTFYRSDGKEFPIRKI